MSFSTKALMVAMVAMAASVSAFVVLPPASVVAAASRAPHASSPVSSRTVRDTGDTSVCVRERQTRRDKYRGRDRYKRGDEAGKLIPCVCLFGLPEAAWLLACAVAPRAREG